MSEPSERKQLRAIRRVLKLLDGYLSTMPDALHAWNGGAMTISELRQHVQAAAALPIFTRKPRLGSPRQRPPQIAR